jgi:dTDP-4-amino-4,6-dideoxygalactose transaminase
LPDSAEPDLASIATVEPRPKAFVLYDALGMLPDPEAVAALGIPVIEDMSTALGAYRGESRAGSLGRVALVGLEPDSIVTSGGGALLFAFNKREATVLRNLGEGIDPEIRMTDYNAALGLAQLREMETTIAKRRELAGAFAQSLARTRHRMISQGGEGEGGYWALPVSIASSVKDVVAYAKKKEVDSVLAFESSLVGKGLVPESACPNARSLAMRCLLFPLHQRIGASAAQKIVKVLATLP